MQSVSQLATPWALSCSLGGSSNKSESLHLDARCVAGGTLKVK